MFVTPGQLYMLSRLPADDRMAGRTVVRAEEFPRTRLLKNTHVNNTHSLSVVSYTELSRHTIVYSVKPLNKGHFGGGKFVPCRKDILFMEVENVVTFGDMDCFLCKKVVPFSEGPLLEVPLYCISTYDVFW